MKSSFMRSFCTLGAVFLTVTSLMAQSIEVQNLDDAPFPDRLAFNRIGSLAAPPTNGVHERVTLRVHNTGASALLVTQLKIAGPDRIRWTVENAPSLPLSIDSGTFVDLTLRFMAESGRRVHNATLILSSNDAAKPSLPVSLSGYWQPVSENNREPTFAQIVEVLGYQTVLVGDEQVFKTHGKITATGEEIISAYWRQADPSIPVTVRQVAAWHTYPENHGIFWHYKGSTAATLIFRHHGEDSQSILPRSVNSTLPALGSFSPSPTTAGGVFGFRIQGSEWSDPALNNSSNDDCSNGPGTCGQHIRFWPAKDRQGALMPNVFIMTMDFAGVNYDFQDNVYVISNITPSTPVAGLQDVRINAGGPALTTGGESYLADIYSSEGMSWTPNCDLGDIAGTTDDDLYRTEYSDGNPFRYAIPALAGVYQIRLHFAEIAHGNCSGSQGGTGKRVFDVSIEGTKVLTNFDISAEVPAVTALIKEFQVGISDGILNLDFLATVDFPMISAIEVLETDNLLPVASFTANPTSGYAPLNVSFNAGSSSDDGFISSYEWTYGDGATDSGVSPSHSYAEAGAYTATLTVTDDRGAQKSATKVITVGQSDATSTISAITWSRVRNQPFKNAEGQGAVVDGKLYSFGGFDSEKACCTPTRRAYVYDPATNKWSAIADLPHTNGGGATHHGIATDGTNIFIAGGYIADAAGTAQIFGTREVYRYDVAANTYTSLPNLPVERAGGRLEHLGGKLYFFGGTNLARTQDVGDHYVLDLGDLPAGWTVAAPLPNPRHHMASVVLGGSIFAIGGQHKHDEHLVAQASVHAYNPESNKWTAVADLPLARGHHAATVLDGRIISMGGEKKHNRAISNVDAYDPATNTWAALTPLPVNRRSGVAGVINGILYYSAGNNALQTYKGVPSITGATQEPVASFTATPDAGEVPLAVEFDATPSVGEIVSYTWNFGDNADEVTTSESTLNYVYSSSGTFVVTLEITDDAGAVSTATDTVAVHDEGTGGSYFLESSGQVVMEAENFDVNINRGSHSWALQAKTGSVGSSLVADPNSGANVDTLSTSPELQFKVLFSTAGSYYVWARVWGDTPNDDSFYAGLDSVPLPTSVSLKNGQREQWFWVNHLMGSTSRARIEVATTGPHTINVWMREDGLHVDRLLLTSDASFVPTGNGPAESPRGDVANSAVASNSPAADALSLTASEMAEASPVQYELSGNYPDPFNPTTTIQYSIPEDVHVKLEVFDILGRRVSVLVDQPQRAGVHLAVFDAGSLASGVYLYRMQAGAFVSVSKMILLE